MITTSFAERVANSERVNIEDLNTGDIVLSEGMAVEITSGPHIHHGDLYAYTGTIINDADLRDADGGFRWPFTGILTEDLAWTVQRREGIEITRQIQGQTVNTIIKRVQAITKGEGRIVGYMAYNAAGECIGYTEDHAVSVGTDFRTLADQA